MSTSKQGDGLDCVTCGACCFSSEPGYIELFSIDRARMDERALSLTECHEDRCFMRFRQGRCVALAVEPSGRFPCAIYPMRPDACRWLEPGSGECHDQRTRKLPLTVSARDSRP